MFNKWLYIRIILAVLMALLPFIVWLLPPGSTVCPQSPLQLQVAPVALSVIVSSFVGFACLRRQWAIWENQKLREVWNYGPNLEGYAVAALGAALLLLMLGLAGLPGTIKNQVSRSFVVLLLYPLAFGLLALGVNLLVAIERRKYLLAAIERGKEKEGKKNGAIECPEPDYRYLRELEGQNYDLASRVVQNLKTMLKKKNRGEFLADAQFAVIRQGWYGDRFRVEVLFWLKELEEIKTEETTDELTTEEKGKATGEAQKPKTKSKTTTRKVQVEYKYEVEANRKGHILTVRRERIERKPE